MEVVASLSQGRTAAAQCGMFTHKSVPVIFEPPSTFEVLTVERASYLQGDMKKMHDKCVAKLI